MVSNYSKQIIKGDDATSIKVPEKYIADVEGSYFGLTGHSHPQSKIPLPDLDDLNYGCITLNSKYNMVFAPGFGATLIKKSNTSVKIDKGSFDVPYESAYKNQKNYVNDKITQRSKEYKESNADKFDYLKIEKRLTEIQNETYFMHFNERVEFFNKEFNQFGIEFLYIRP